MRVATLHCLSTVKGAQKGNMRLGLGKGCAIRVHKEEMKLARLPKTLRNDCTIKKQNSKNSRVRSGHKSLRHAKEVVNARKFA
eukprot:scaffold102179_cov18-Tisochrysis_lutea.AAC.2